MVYKWFLTPLILLFGCNSSTESKELYAEVPSISVGVKRVANTCSEIELLFFVDRLEEDVVVPKGITGIDDKHFSLATVSLSSIERIDRKFPLEIKESIEGHISLSAENSPYIVKLDLRETFGSLNGDYYFKYSYAGSFENIGTVNGTSIELAEVINSERYLINFGANGCIDKFFGDHL